MAQKRVVEVPDNIASKLNEFRYLSPFSSRNPSGGNSFALTRHEYGKIRDHFRISLGGSLIGPREEGALDSGDRLVIRLEDGVAIHLKKPDFTVAVFENEDLPFVAHDKKAGRQDVQSLLVNLLGGLWKTAFRNAGAEELFSVPKEALEALMRKLRGPAGTYHFAISHKRSVQLNYSHMRAPGGGEQAVIYYDNRSMAVTFQSINTMFASLDGVATLLLNDDSGLFLPQAAGILPQVHEALGIGWEMMDHPKYAG